MDMNSNLYNAFKILRESGILLERDMTPEQREAAKRRRQARRAEAKGKPVSSGNWAVMLGNGYPTPEFFKSHKPVGTSDAVLQIVTRNLQRRNTAELLGLYPTRKKAKEVAEEVLNRLMSMHSSAYGVRYNCPEPTVVEYVPENKKWCTGISGPGDCGYLYDRDKALIKDSVIVDKVIGRAAAFIIIKGGAAEVFGKITSEDALQLLKKHNIPVTYDLLVPRILNQKRNGLCPLEDSVKSMEDADTALSAMRKRIQELRRK